jgi:tetratricopeptide (TPR) repeat protein
MFSSEPAAGDDRGRLTQLPPWAGPALLGGLVYLNSLHNPFVYDDWQTVVDNPSITHLFDIRRIVLYRATRPIVNFSYALDRSIWGSQVAGFHVTNVILHVVNIVLFYALARRLAEDRQRRNPVRAGEPRVVAMAAALLFAVHPLMTEAVGYVSGRSELLCGMFFLAAFLSARRWMIGGRQIDWLLTVVLWMAALASKEIAAVFPFVAAAYGRLVLGGSAADRRRRVLRLHLPLVTLAIVAAVVRLGVFVLVEHPANAIVHWKYALVELEVTWRYVLLFMMPGSQAIFHEVAPIRSLLEPRAWFALLTIAVIAASAWRVRNVVSLVSFGICWFLLLLIPSAVLVMLDLGEPMVEHRVYVASCGLFLATGVAVARFGAVFERPRHRRLVATLATAGVFSLCGATIVRNAVWSRPVTLWMEAVEGAPDHWRARLMLGEALQDEGRCREAITQYRLAISMRPQEQFGYMKLGLCLAEIGRLDEAASAFERLRQLDPGSAVASVGLGAIAMLRGQPDRARQYFIDTIHRDPGNVPARQSLAVLEETVAANPTEALRRCEEIRQLAPETPGNDECIRRNRSRLGAGAGR